MIIYRHRHAEQDDPARCDIAVRGAAVRVYTLFGSRKRRMLRQCKGEATRFFRFVSWHAIGGEQVLFSVRLCHSHAHFEELKVRGKNPRLRMVEITQAEYEQDIKKEQYEADRHRAEQESAQAVSPRAAG